MASIPRPSQTFPYGEAIKKPPPNDQRHGTKLEKKIDQDQPPAQEVPQQKQTWGLGNNGNGGCDLISKQNPIKKNWHSPPN